MCSKVRMEGDKRTTAATALLGQIGDKRKATGEEGGEGMRPDTGRTRNLVLRPFVSPVCGLIDSEYH